MTYGSEIVLTYTHTGISTAPLVVCFSVEKARRTLSSQQSTRIEIESFNDSNDFSETLTRAKFKELNMDSFRKP